MLVDAYDKRTGKKLPNRVPEHWIGHPVFGKHLTRRLRARRGETQADATQTPAKDKPTDPPASGDKKEK